MTNGQGKFFCKNLGAGKIRKLKTPAKEHLLNRVLNLSRNHWVGFNFLFMIILDLKTIIFGHAIGKFENF